MVRLGLCLGWVYSLVKLLLPISLLMWTRYAHWQMKRTQARGIKMMGRRGLRCIYAVRLMCQ